MLCIAFNVGTARYAIEALHVERVVPLLNITPTPQSSASIVGVCNYHGDPVPVVDLSASVGHGSAARLLSTRLIVVKRGDLRVALLAEGVTETTHIPAGAWVGPYAAQGTSFIERLDLDSLMSSIRALA